ncbi:MAG: aminoglycoside/choline kinase family phosphotransferase [Planctomycetota bacterium]|jgi:aminoglycoside/choline kinase family phosphotransferase
MSDRLTEINEWLSGLGHSDYVLEAASADASFRRYFRVKSGDQSWVVMDAPPEQEPCDRFIAIAEKIRQANLSAPVIYAQDLGKGFLLLSDFGSNDYLSLLDNASEAELYTDALLALLQMQTLINADDLPAYDEELLNREMDLFEQWFLRALMGIELDESERRQWQKIKSVLVENALAQPNVFVHRDYHSRNLMRTSEGNPGILDFQDAVKGPISYDLVSLLRDCYIDWPESRVEQLAKNYYQMAQSSGLVSVDLPVFMRWFDLMGVQRHLKAIGIFSRLKLRDDKEGYIKDIPRTLAYVSSVCARVPAMAELYTLIDGKNLAARLALYLP